ncbi:hypothetical protein KAI32_01600 [Candidatus Pacearchaeota archaeon]|nr:hypothetical protein [Candidatus Pacearchaeota archaeon]
MIGRTLDAMLDIPQLIARNFSMEVKSKYKAYNDSEYYTKIIYPFLNLTQEMKNIVLPVEKKKLYRNKLTFEPDYERGKGWCEFDSEDWETKRKLAKVFENRRKVKTGESFQEEDVYRFWCGSTMKKYEVERVEKNTVLYRGNVISSNEKELINYAKKGFNPIHYKHVIF